MLLSFSHRHHLLLLPLPAPLLSSFSLLRVPGIWPPAKLTTPPLFAQPSRSTAEGKKTKNHQSSLHSRALSHYYLLPPLFSIATSVFLLQQKDPKFLPRPLSLLKIRSFNFPFPSDPTPRFIAPPVSHSHTQARFFCVAYSLATLPQAKFELFSLTEPPFPLPLKIL